MNHLRQLGNKISVHIPADGEGFTGRECPNPDCEGYFKIVFGTGLESEDPPCTCPYCGHTAEHDEYWTREQIEYAESIALREITDAFYKELKTLEFDHESRGPFGIGFSMKVKSGRPTPIHHYREKKLETDVVCTNCTLRYSVYGVFAFCPDCGQHNSLQIFEKNMEVVRKMLDLAGNTEQDLSVRLVENALENCVSTFDGFGRELCRVYVHHASNLVKANKIRFQNCDEARLSVKKAFGIDLAQSCGEEVWRQVVRLFQKRHVIAHKMGVVDQEYVDRTGDTNAIVGRKIVLRVFEVQQLADTLRSAAESISLQFKCLDNEL